MPGVVLMDLPGIDAPSDKARRDTEDALTNEVDVTIFVKDVTRPSLVRNEIELLRTVQSADRSISLKDRIFVVLTKVDLFDRARRERQLALGARRAKLPRAGRRSRLPVLQALGAPGAGHGAPGRHASSWTSTARPRR